MSVTGVSGDVSVTGVSRGVSVSSVSGVTVPALREGDAGARERRHGRDREQRAHQTDRPEM
ncbi:MAG TPA: hypothetical protein VMF09_06315 [Solirubrobacteraceae bacterium]|nr:hypothetical protein [Solirubrobacteraceae bacterium]